MNTTHSPKADQNGTEPDPDSIKMFVGQVPRSMDENDLRKIFEEFGGVYQLNVLRDKVTAQSKGSFLSLVSCHFHQQKEKLWNIVVEKRFKSAYTDSFSSSVLFLKGTSLTLTPVSSSITFSHSTVFLMKCIIFEGFSVSLFSNLLFVHSQSQSISGQTSVWYQSQILISCHHHCLYVFVGCCFVTFYTRKAALDAQNALHNIKTMPGVSVILLS